MHQKDVAEMAGYTSAGFITYGTHSEHRAARVWIAFVRVKRLGKTRCHASLRPQGPGSHSLGGYTVRWRETTGKAVFSRRLERAFDCIFGGEIWLHDFSQIAQTLLIVLTVKK